MKQSLLDVSAALQLAGYPCQLDEAESLVIVQVPLRDKLTGPVLKAALATGADITEGRATRRGFELVVA